VGSELLMRPTMALVLISCVDNMDDGITDQN
jgi:hypothetical protein